MFAELLTPPSHLIYTDRLQSDIASAAPDYLQALIDAYAQAGIDIPVRGRFSGPWIVAPIPEGKLFLELHIYTQAQRRRLWQHTSSLKAEAASTQVFNQIINQGDCYAVGTYQAERGVRDYVPTSAYIKLITQNVVQLRESGLFVPHQGEVQLIPAAA